MSFGRLGIAHFPVVHRQFSSPTSSRYAESLSGQDDVTQDNKDVLLERLNDLMQRLTKNGPPIEDKAVTNMHHLVDGIETLMREKPQLPNLDDFDTGSESGDSKEQDRLWAPSIPRSPIQNIRIRLPDSWRDPPPSAPPKQEMTTSKATEIAEAAEELAAQLAKTAIELQIRREESDHIHDLLVTRAEKAAERILLLEYRVAEMEDDFSSNQSELKFLRIQLQAIEAQCSQYIPLTSDKELAESITKWKFDWEEIDRKSKARRKKCQDSRPNSDDSGTIVNGS
ncbi:hypothetical protein LCER1_G000821 [Lachnellula cervina]|uniref:Uncharacterized protein n=1 Tax=Lachnellula cervina TaxID=1316786 RepID=A0A7D8YWL4_9HELO|nr:hypothetical protein LCER1_G000821 [Lachnellula cervina]